MLLASVGFGWFANELSQAKFESKLVEEISSWHDGHQPHGECRFDYESFSQAGKTNDPIGPAWIRSMFGQHVFSRITSISFNGKANVRELNRRDISTFKPGNKHTLAFEVVEELDLTDLESLASLRFNDFSEMEDLCVLQTLRNLEHVSVVGCENFYSLKGIENQRQLRTVRVIKHKSNLIDISPLEGLGELELIDIDVRGDFGTPANWDVLSKRTKLIRLHVEGKPVVLDQDAIELEKGVFGPSPNLQVLTLEEVEPGLVDLNCFREMSELNTLVIQGSAVLESLEGLEHCENLISLTIESCPRLKDVSAIGTLAKLKSLTIANSGDEIELVPVLTCSELEHLNLKGMCGFEDLEFLRNAGNLLTLDCSDSGLQSLKGLRHLKLLTRLQVDGSGLKGIDCHSVDAPIEKLDLEDCDELVGLEGLENIANLKSVNLQGCMELRNLKGLRNFDAMTSLNLTDCRSLTNLDGLKVLSQLEHVVVVGCVNLDNVDGLFGLSKLKSFDWSDCPKLSSEKVESVRKKFPRLDESPDVLDHEFKAYPRRQ